MSRTVIIHPVLLGILIALILLFLGAGSTPHDRQGRPLLLLPQVRLAGDYQRAARGWERDLEGLDGDLAGLLRGDAVDILAESSKAEQELERSDAIAQAIKGRSPPGELAGLGEELAQTAQEYQAAAAAAAQAVSVPDAAHLRAAREALGRASKDLDALEKNPWLTNEP